MSKNSASGSQAIVTLTSCSITFLGTGWGGVKYCCTQFQAHLFRREACYPELQLSGWWLLTVLYPGIEGFVEKLAILDCSCLGYDYWLFCAQELRDLWRSLLSCAGIFKKSMGGTHRVGIGLSYRPAMLHRLAELMPWHRFLGSIRV